MDSKISKEQDIEHLHLENLFVVIYDNIGMCDFRLATVKPLSSFLVFQISAWFCTIKYLFIRRNIRQWLLYQCRRNISYATVWGAVLLHELNYIWIENNYLWFLTSFLYISTKKTYKNIEQFKIIILVLITQTP